MRNLLLIFGALIVFVKSPAQSVNIIRGPYLNSVATNSAVIRWRTERPTDSRVVISVELNNEDKQIQFDDPAVVTDHELVLKNLAPATIYFYSVGSTKSPVKFFTEQYFRTSPAIGSTMPLRIWALGDFGNSSKNQLQCRDAILNETANHRPDLWLWLGDNAYNIGLDEEYQRHVFRVYQESFFKNTTLYPSPGNHDYGRARHDPTDIAYYKIFTLPKEGEAGGVPSGSEAYYSVDYGNVHVVSLDSQGELDGGHRIYDTLSRQIEWLKKDLAANQLPWTIVFFHHPPYTMGSHNSDREDELVKIRENLLIIFERFNVDLVLNGHSHVYERTHPLRKHYGKASTFDFTKHVVEQQDAPNHYRVNKKIGQGVIYIVSGSGGKVGGQEEGYPLRAAKFYNNTIGGSLLIDIEDNTMDARWLCADGMVRDQFWIVKEK